MGFWEDYGLWTINKDSTKNNLTFRRKHVNVVYKDSSYKQVCRSLEAKGGSWIDHDRI